jgi:uncharacterized membrane protein
MFDSLDPLFNVMAIAFLLSFVIIGIVLIVWLGSLPGTIAEARRHPQTDAVRAAGWLGILFLPLWPIAFVWALWTGQAKENHHDLCLDTSLFIHGVVDLFSLSLAFVQLDL